MSYAETNYVSTQKNKILSQTYMLLSANIFWAAFMAFISISTGISDKIVQAGGYFVFGFLIAYFGVLFAIEKFKNSSTGLILTFVLTGMLGFTLSPMLSFALNTGNTDAVFLALAGTAIVFFSMSAYGKTTKRNLDSWSKFLVFGLLAAFILSLINVFFIQASIFSLVLSFVFMFLSSMVMAWQTQRIVNGGENNYISATVSLFVALYNVFSSLLHILLSFTGMDE